MEIESKIIDFYLYTIYSGWMYILDKNYFLPGDVVTDGEKNYKIIDNSEITTDPRWRPAIPYDNRPVYWLYHFEDRIENFKDKILKRAPVA